MAPGLDQLYDATGLLEMYAIGADVIVDAAGPAWHDSSVTTINDFRPFVYYDIDNALGLSGSASTFNSSSVDFSLASGKSVQKAFLVWGAKVLAAFDNDAVGPQADVSLYVQNTANVPSGSYVTVSATGGRYLNSLGATGSWDGYGLYADVTPYFSSLASGNNYKVVVGNVDVELSALQGGAAGGWVLYLIVNNPSLTQANYVAIYGGASFVRGTTIDVPLTGLNVPASASGGPISRRRPWIRILARLIPLDSALTRAA